MFTMQDSGPRQPSAGASRLSASVAAVCATGQASHAVTAANPGSITTVRADNFNNGSGFAAQATWFGGGQPWMRR